jgi:hypothetical protein
MAYSPQNYAEYDTLVTHNGNPSIHVKAGSAWAGGEVDGAWISLKPGDHIVFTGYVKTGDFSPTDLQAGAGFGFDFYAHTNQGYGILFIDPTLQAGHPTSAEKNHGDPDDFGYSINGASGLTQESGKTVKVPFGTDWTLIEWDFIVPETNYYYVYTNNVVPCFSSQIDSLVFWTWVDDNGEAWFSDPALYINPSESSLPTPTAVSITVDGSVIMSSVILIFIMVVLLGKSVIEKVLNKVIPLFYKK